MAHGIEMRILDTDSHVMELPDFLDDFIDPAEAPRLRRRAFEALGPVRRMSRLLLNFGGGHSVFKQPGDRTRKASPAAGRSPDGGRRRTYPCLCIP